MLNVYERKGIFKAIFERRDIRSFNRKPISRDKLNNILMAGSCTFRWFYETLGFYCN
ncbi:cob(II)yrinic acid a,c-diamide reductase [Paenibacillus polymyxa]|nr:cob(II)yrinic acid a,c-diamide reductase [Paenibacillus polymyxa]